jgi:hypothetical protein
MKNIAKNFARLGALVATGLTAAACGSGLEYPIQKETKPRVPRGMSVIPDRDNPTYVEEATPVTQPYYYCVKGHFEFPAHDHTGRPLKPSKVKSNLGYQTYGKYEGEGVPITKVCEYSPSWFVQGVQHITAKQGTAVHHFCKAIVDGECIPEMGPFGPIVNQYGKYLGRGVIKVRRNGYKGDIPPASTRTYEVGPGYQLTPGT